MYTYATVYNKYHHIFKKCSAIKRNDVFLYQYFEAFGMILLENTFDLECKDLGSNFTRCLHTI